MYYLQASSVCSCCFRWLITQYMIMLLIPIHRFLSPLPYPLLDQTDKDKRKSFLPWDMVVSSHLDFVSVWFRIGFYLTIFCHLPLDDAFYVCVCVWWWMISTIITSFITLLSHFYHTFYIIHHILHAYFNRYRVLIFSVILHIIQVALVIRNIHKLNIILCPVLSFYLYLFCSTSPIRIPYLFHYSYVLIHFRYYDNSGRMEEKEITHSIQTSILLPAPTASCIPTTTSTKAASILE